MKIRKIAVLLGGLFMALSLCSCKKGELSRNDYRLEEFGENVYFFTEDDDPEEINALLEHIWQKQETNQFGDERYAVYFMPGDYSEVNLKVGFYTQAAGLDIRPDGVKIGSLVTDARWLGDDSNHQALCNFWRGVENMEVKSEAEFAVSQATFVRRMQFDANLALHDEYGWASGGFLADSKIDGVVDSGPQQQWLSRNNDYKGWTGENWNIVFLGDEEEGIPEGRWPEHSYTCYENTTRIQEKPFLVYEKEQGFGVFVPAFRENAQGVSWEEEESGSFIPLEEFYVARADVDDETTMNKALAEGKHLLLTPGIYEIHEPIKVEKENTIVLGMGLATLRSMEGSVCLETSDAEGIKIAGLLFDAGTTEAQNLLVVGDGSNKNTDYSGKAPLSLSDLFFRIGGCDTESPCKVESAVTINASNVVTDNFWVWRADHTDMVGWDLNTAKNGIIINGDDVTLYALMVEHFQEYQTIINGERDEIIMYQCETPYDAPSAFDWRCSEDKLGYSSIFVNEEVNEFKGTAIGIYLYNRDAKTPLISAITLPDKEGVSVENVITVVLNGYPGIRYPVNEAGDSVIHPGETAKLLYYCNGEWK